MVSAEFEPVLQINEYFDGPRSGIAQCQSEKCNFRSLWKDVDGVDDAPDEFELEMLSGVDRGQKILANAMFRKVAHVPVMAGAWPCLEVLWQLKLRSHNYVLHTASKLLCVLASIALLGACELKR